MLHYADTFKHRAVKSDASADVRKYNSKIIKAIAPQKLRQCRYYFESAIARAVGNHVCNFYRESSRVRIITLLI